MSAYLDRIIEITQEKYKNAGSLNDFFEANVERPIYSALTGSSKKDMYDQEALVTDFQDALEYKIGHYTDWKNDPAIAREHWVD